MNGDLSFNISFDLGSKLDITAMVNKQVMPLLHQAVNAVGQQVAINWKTEVMQAKLWSGEKDAYVQSISWKMTGDFSGVAEATYKHASQIENGRPPRDLKKMLDTSSKVRRTKTGKRFLVIPMRHNVKKLENAGLYDAAKSLEASTVTGRGKRASGEVTYLSPKTGMRPAPKSQQSRYLSDISTKKSVMVPRNHYAWGQRLAKADAGGHKWAEGIYRFNTSAGKGKSSSYISFRIMMEGSSGWVIPAKPGLGIAKKVAQDMQPKAVAVFGEAVKRTIG